MPHLWTLGLNHDTAALDLRARFAVDAALLPEQLASLQALMCATCEVALLCTCNRTEIYGASDTLESAQTDRAAAQNWLAQLGCISSDQLQSHLYTRAGESAIEHTLRLASGLESMMLGETQILGQMKDAVRTAQNTGTVGTHLNHLFQKVFSVAKDVRSQTAIGQQTVSFAAAATKLAANVFEDWAHTRVLLVGAGEMIELCAAHFAAKSPAALCVANRTLERGAALAKRFSTNALSVQTMTLGELPAKLPTFDVVVSCTSSTLPIIGLGVVQSAIKARKHRPMVMIDLAVPRDIEPQVKDLSDVYLYTVDDLGVLVQTGVQERTRAAEAAKTLIDAGVRQIQERLHSTQSVGKIQALQERATQWQTDEIEKTKSKLKPFLANMDEQALDIALQGFARALSQKFLHEAIKDIKNA